MIDLILDNEQVEFSGLMTIGSFTKQESMVRESFYLLAKMRDRVISKYPELKKIKLSIGMSNDFEWAIEEGSDMLRLGRILFDH